jgi:hypothetical protein
MITLEGQSRAHSIFIVEFFILSEFSLVWVHLLRVSLLLILVHVLLIDLLRHFEVVKLPQGIGILDDSFGLHILFFRFLLGIQLVAKFSRIAEDISNQEYLFSQF